uniref:Uncharacterized protein n=1 Tax=Oncorhynchus mykiss TaxID=8022 RepID=A0A8C7PA86_ONCMY
AHHDVEELLTSIKQNQECCETARTQLTQYLEQNDDRLLHYNNRLAKLQRILDRVRSETMLWVRGQHQTLERLGDNFTSKVQKN